MLGFFVLPEKCWWVNYYTPSEKKISGMKSTYQGDEEALRILACEEVEIEMFRKYSGCYGYVFYVLQKMIAE